MLHGTEQQGQGEPSITKLIARSIIQPTLGPRKHQDPTDVDFWNLPPAGTYNKDRILVFMLYYIILD